MHGLFCLQYRDSPPSVPHCRRTIVSDASSLFDNTQFAPDAVLLNLGTNDMGHDSGPAWEAAFTAAYAQFLVDLTAAHQNPALVCTSDVSLLLSTACVDITARTCARIRLL